MPEWLGSGLQNRVRRFNSGSGLHKRNEMSKKDKSKFRKQIKAQLLQEVAQAQKEMTPGKSAPAVVLNTPATINPSAPVAASAVAAPAVLTEINLPQIKHDLKKTGIVVGCLVVLMVAIYYLDLKYGILINFGNWLFKVLHIQ